MSPYFEGYLAAERSGTYWYNGVLRNIPVTRYHVESVEFRVWLQGVADNAMDHYTPRRQLT